jgi:hypothetical protein
LDRSRLTVRIIDSFVDGSGAGKVLLLSAFEVAHDAGTPEMNSGSLHRFLAEAVWYPWALLPSDTLNWHGIDDRRALATLTVHGTQVSLEFRFAEGGEVEAIYSPGRWGRFDGAYAKIPWEGHFSGHHRRNGLLVPLYGEVGWYRDHTPRARLERADQEHGWSLARRIAAERRGRCWYELFSHRPEIKCPGPMPLSSFR